jgi:rSAM/selenodomain-associated transferase 1
VIISPEYRRRLIIMVKEPRAGRVKTRLGADIGMTTAAWWFRHQVRDLLRATDDARWQTLLAVSPDRAINSRAWPAKYHRTPQGRGDLGRRMGTVFDQLPRGPAVVVGGDIPGISRAHIWSAFREIDRHDAVFGPATDGGYWLIGLKRSRSRNAGMFQGVRWSTAHALADTVRSMPGYGIAYVDTLNDVDTQSDLTRST